MNTTSKPEVGPCAKQTVTATIVTKSGARFIGTNHCMNPQTACPRGDMPTGVGYELCISVCQQTAHAEVNAIEAAGAAADGATLYLEGHSYACFSCTAAARSAGIAEIVIGKPPLRGGRSYSVHLSTRGAIRDLARLPAGEESYFTDQGATLTNGEALANLTIELAKGRECLPMSKKCGAPCAQPGCSGFNYGAGGGCPGYPTPEKEKA